MAGIEAMQNNAMKAVEAIVAAWNAAGWVYAPNSRSQAADAVAALAEAKWLPTNIQALLTEAASSCDDQAAQCDEIERDYLYELGRRLREAAGV